MNKKVILITGASSGIGREAAIALLKEGHIVYTCARHVDVMKDLEAMGAVALPIDVTDELSMQQCVQTILEKETGIDVLVNNAGYGSCGALEDIPLSEARHQYEVNVFGLVRMIQLVLPSMRARKTGRIINISSMGGRFTSPYGGWYHSTKYAVESISDALRGEVKPFGIDVVLIEPGMIQTNWGLIAASNIRKYSKDGAYAKDADAAASYYEKNYRKDSGRLTSPAMLGQVICKACLVKRPKLRYLTGKYSHSFIFLKAVLPDRLFSDLSRSSMGLK